MRKRRSQQELVRPCHVLVFYGLSHAAGQLMSCLAIEAKGFWVASAPK